MSKKSKKKKPERRHAQRRPILDTFSIFLVAPAKGPHKLTVYDLSEDGIGFDLNIEGEPPSEIQPLPGTPLELNLYLNSSLYIPLTVQIVRINHSRTSHRVGALFQDLTSPQYEVFLSFLKFLDALLGVAQIEPVGK